MRVHKVDDLDTNLLVPLAEESAREGFRHVGRLINEYDAEARKSYHKLVLKTDNPQADGFYRSIGFSISSDSDTHTHFLKLENNE